MAMAARKGDPAPSFVAGDRVRYTDKYLKSMSADRNDDWWSMHGRVISQVAWTVYVAWDDWGDDTVTAVLARNVEAVDV